MGGLPGIWVEPFDIIDARDSHSTRQQHSIQPDSSIRGDARNATASPDARGLALSPGHNLRSSSSPGKTTLARPRRRVYHACKMNERDEYLAADDPALLAQCEVHIYKSSGPGGQHRNKVSSAIRLHHRPTGIKALANESRSQHNNKTQALRRLRMNIACRLRCTASQADFSPPEVVAECLFTARGGQAAGTKRLGVGRKDRRFWRVGAVLLDLLEASAGQLAPAAAAIGITTGNFTRVLKSDRHLLAGAQQIRKCHGRGSIN